jgi:hypothetical protein
MATETVPSENRSYMANTVLRRRLAVTITAFNLAVLAGGLLLPPFDAWDIVLSSLIAAPFSAIGGLVTFRRPLNPVGWLMLCFGTVAAFNFAATQYFTYGAVAHPGSLAGTDLVISLAVHTWHPGFALFILAFFLFPNGRPLSPRWRVAVIVTAALGFTGVIAGMFEFEFQRTFDPALAPYMDPLFGGLPRTIGDIVFGTVVILMVAMFVLSAISIMIRLRRARGAHRQQVKWVAYAIVLAALALPTSVLVIGDGSFGAPLFGLIPISMAIAILRYRLFDIDRLIRRTIVYAAVTVVLGSSYFILTGLALPLVAGGEDTPAVFVAALTLLLAAAFRPVHNRIQSMVDRRFNRRRYDASTITEAFATRMRDELDINALSSELAATVGESMEPAHVSVWLKRTTVGRS